MKEDVYFQKNKIAYFLVMLAPTHSIFPGVMLGKYVSKFLEKVKTLFEFQFRSFPFLRPQTVSVGFCWFPLVSVACGRLRQPAPTSVAVAVFLIPMHVRHLLDSCLTSLNSIL